ncbi:MAG: glycosyltransferase [Candidatus Delongbacteria bacterium]|nr:glycosyltransferase [Candidatus Delongbacteria bacterium]
MDLSVIIVNYNVKYFLENTIHSVKRTVSDLSYEIIVIDNASKDDSKEYITSRFSDITYIFNEANVGFAKANNQGLKIAKGDFVLILNPDTIVKERTIKLLIDHLKTNPKTGLVTCKIIGPEGNIDPSSHRSFPTAWNSFCHISGLARVFHNSRLFSAYNLLYIDDDLVSEVDAVSGSFMLFRREILNEGTYMPEDYFMYGEDIDFCYQIKKMGYKIEYVPIGEIIHFRGQSSKKDRIKLRKYFYSSMKIFVNKNYSSRYSIFFQIILELAIFTAYSMSVGRIFLNKFILPIIDIASYFGGLVLAIAAYTPLMYILGINREIGYSSIKIEMYLSVSVIYTFIIITVFLLNSVYTSMKHSYRQFLKSMFFISLTVISITFFMRNVAFSRAILFLMLVFSGSLMFAWRILLLRKMKFFLNNTVIVGIDDISKSLVNLDTELANEGMMITGFIDTNHEYLGKNIGNYAVLGNIKYLIDIMKVEEANNVLFSLKSISLPEIMSYKEILRSNKMKFKIIPDFVSVKDGKIQYLNVSD